MKWTKEREAIAIKYHKPGRTALWEWKKNGEIPDSMLSTERQPLEQWQEHDRYMLLLMIDAGFIQGDPLARKLGRGRGTFSVIASARKRPGTTPGVSLYRDELVFISEQILTPLRTLVYSLEEEMADDGAMPIAETLGRVVTLLSNPGLKIRRVCRGMDQTDYMRMRHLCLYGAKFNQLDRPLLLAILNNLRPLTVKPQARCVLIPEPSPS
ncbi:MAG: hypothetical protein EOO39_00175 [Cytophagaceae bacterium]|nr:MAG: hypothetical protein EOO39_00175 [Cytophagaceae bacterium]